MSRPVTTADPKPEPGPAVLDAEPWRCLDCSAGLDRRKICPRCGRSYPEAEGILSAIGPLTGRNRIAGAFYEGPGWARFRPWERLFLRLQGGEGRARRQILRHLVAPPTSRVLEVGIGDGANLGLIPSGWSAYGVDLARTPLRDCLARLPLMNGRLAHAEAEALPFADGSFDACWSIGGFNYFRDHAAALREMNRVTRPGGILIVADEVPNLHRFGIGHLIGLKQLDASWLRALGLDREFVAMVLSNEVDVEGLIRRVWSGATRHSIWFGLGYCFVSQATPNVSETPLSRSPL
ncbi:class I SAM-dependent methyltransferase [Tundrisphaera lichenicola]|uniref:class I SAM-dependent methyltransferase n=1 Tax=Tundrisphaera lichenicola TaxID=2029860 RepID=UPI003EBA88BF